jgi:carbon-monoxide dehydrogenase medium subunit
LVGVFVARTADGVRVAVTGAKACVFRCTELENALAADFSAAAAKSVRLSPEGYAQDLHASGAYRAAMVSVMAARAVQTILDR